MTKNELTEFLKAMIKENKLLFYTRDSRMIPIKDLRMFSQEGTIVFYERKKQ